MTPSIADDAVMPDAGGPVSLDPLGPALGGADADADADAGQVGQHRGGEFGGQGEAGGVAAGVGSDAVAVQTDAEQDVHGRAGWALAGEEPPREGSQPAARF